MILITKEQNARLHQLLSHSNMMDDKANIVKQYTAGRTESSRLLSTHEALDIIEDLAEQDNSANKMRKKLLHLGYMMMWDQPANSQQQGLKPQRINYMNVSNWCASDKCKHKKPLNKLSPVELPMVVSQLEQVYKSFNKKVAENA